LPRAPKTFLLTLLLYLDDNVPFCPR
jgi:hypothetical protein